MQNNFCPSTRQRNNGPSLTAHVCALKTWLQEKTWSLYPLRNLKKVKGEG